MAARRTLTRRQAGRLDLDRVRLFAVNAIHAGPVTLQPGDDVTQIVRAWPTLPLLLRRGQIRAEPLDEGEEGVTVEQADAPPVEPIGPNPPGTQSSQSPAPPEPPPNEPEPPQSDDGADGEGEEGETDDEPHEEAEDAEGDAEGPDRKPGVLGSLIDALTPGHHDKPSPSRRGKRTRKH